MSQRDDDRGGVGERLLDSFEELMPFRVQEILLVSSLYDSFILREDGRLNELMLGESVDLDLRQTPGIAHVESGAKALELALSHPYYNLIIANLQFSDMDAAELARRVAEAGLDVPVVVLAYDQREIEEFTARHPSNAIDRIFLWQGSPRILTAIVKYVEDSRNAAHDTQLLGVPVLLLVEDNIRHYSSFLPVIYTEIITQSERLLGEGLNAAHKLLRLRARPRILLCTTYEEAVARADEFRGELMAVISDVEFPRGGELDAEAGFKLASHIHAQVRDVPVVLHSDRAEFMERARVEGLHFLPKGSPNLLAGLRRFLLDHAGFGDFIFRLPGGQIAGRAGNLQELESLLRQVPEACIAYHGYRNHFSHWLRARTEFALAERLRPRRVSDFHSIEDLRRDLIDSITSYRAEQSHLLIADFPGDSFQPGEEYFLRLGAGSLGGKARGAAFMRQLLCRRALGSRWPGVRLRVPDSLVLATECFDEFMEQNALGEFAMSAENDEVLLERFLSAPLPEPRNASLREFLAKVTHPLAVRSSSLLEDSQYQPFTGVYETCMLANLGTLDERLAALTGAIRRVWASTYRQRAKAYMRATSCRLEEERMAVLVQQLSGAVHGDRFYPEIAGVARSRNFYPHPPAVPADGVATVCLGLGRSVVEGGKALSFCPKYPQSLVQFSSVQDMLENSQREFWALDLRRGEQLFSLAEAERDGTLAALASTYSAENQAVYDGASRPGARLVSFAPVLKHGVFPLAEIVGELLRLGEESLSRPVEIEFAVTFRAGEAVFDFLQLRPLIAGREDCGAETAEMPPERILCRSRSVMGQGRVELSDAIVVDAARYERSRSREVAADVAAFNARLAGRPYLLAGAGRWGSNDPWLGIPVRWDQVSGARVIVEAGLRDMHVTPSQGSHFFQNLTAFQVGYFTVNPEAGEGWLDWEWLSAQTAVEERGCVRLLHFAAPLLALMHGQKGEGFLLKPDGSPAK
jgi:CheY-like chemotaxis protein